MKNSVWLPAIFSDHMVLQREVENPVWGRAAPETDVVVSIADQQHTTTADSEGKWCLKLDAMPAGGPHVLTVSAGETRTFDDVLVGEVWIGSGQSNMGFPLKNCEEASLERVTANYPEIRHINVPQVASQVPLEDFEGAWAPCTPDNIEVFAGLPYFFGRRLYHALGVPVGVISCCWGGASAEAWVPRELLEADERYHPVLKEWDDAVANHTEEGFEKARAESEAKQAEWVEQGGEGNHTIPPRNPVTNQRRPANCYNGQLAPIMGYGTKGFIWYQGESNTHPIRDYDYRFLFPSLISKFREDWCQGDVPFYWVQLTSWDEKPLEDPKDHWPMLRESQTLTLDKVPNGGEAVTWDLGEGRDLHPRNKQRIADRLARIALARDYGFDLVYQSPRFDAMEVKGNTATLTFKHVTEEGLRSFETKDVKGFTIAGEDQVFHPATAEIVREQPNQVNLFSEEVPRPVAVRYAWTSNPDCNLYDAEGLPVTPFRTDEW